MILHIPHSSTNIPNGDIPNLNQLNLMTDWYTDELFSHDSADRLVFQYSRFYCDVERLIDDPLDQKGLGVFYTHDYDGNEYRKRDKEMLEVVFKDYHEWHKKLRQCASNALSYIPNVVVVDCHSFHSTDSEVDICIGVNDSNTPKELVDTVKCHFEKFGYCVKINDPYEGAIIPFDDKHLFSIMIELNKRLYLNDEYQKNENFKLLKTQISECLDLIHYFEINYKS